MKSSISKKDLENDPLFDTLQALHSCVTKLGLELYVVGATARDLIMKLLDESPSKRETSDLDVAIVLSDWSQFDNLSKELLANHFHKGKSKQKFYYKGEHHENDYEVDIVPFGDIADDEVILWPPDTTYYYIASTGTDESPSPVPSSRTGDTSPPPPASC